MHFVLQLEESLEKLLQAPQQFNQISKSTIIQLSKIHNKHNRLLPPQIITQIIDELYALKPFENRKSSLKFSFYYNIIRHVILSNFHQLKDNKVFAVVAMIYGQKLSDFYHQVQSEQKSLVILKHVAQVTIMNQISLKYIQRSKVFFPQYVKALILSLQKLQHSISRNIRHGSKVAGDSTQFSTIQGVLNLAFSKQTEKKELIFILVGLLNFVLKQASSFFTTNANKKELLRLQGVQSAIEKIHQLHLRLPQQIGSQMIVPPQFKKYQPLEGQEHINNQNQPIYLEETIKVKELTPRFYNEEEGTQNKLLRKKKNKLEKKMQLQIRQSTHHKLQERRIIDDVKKDKIQKQVKKEIFVLQKQTQQAKKYHKQMKKVKSIKKQAKPGRKGKR